MIRDYAKEDRIFLGEGLFETLRVSHAKPCFADLHWQRLKKAALELSIPFDLGLEDWQSLLADQIQKNRLIHGGIKVLLSGGPAHRHLTEPGQNCHLVLQTFQTIRKDRPLRLVSAPWLRDALNPIYGWKSINYLEAILARRQAQSQGADDALFYNTQHHATETTCANLFAIQKNTLWTPPLQDGVLPGITRTRLLNLSRQQGVTCEESSLTWASLAQADALFLTNSLQGIQRVLSLDQLVFDSSPPLLGQLAEWLDPGHGTTT